MKKDIVFKTEKDFIGQVEYHLFEDGSCVADCFSSIEEKDIIISKLEDAGYKYSVVLY